ncbi:MAG: arginine--tRNA ligase [Crocinitomicaceae bacterium]
MQIEETLSKLVIQSVKESYNQEIEGRLVQFQKTKKEFDGDITLVTFPMLKISKKSPEQTGVLIGEYLKENSDLIVEYNTVKGFLNLVVSNQYYCDQLNSVLNSDNYGFSLSNNQLYMVEYSSPNTNKPLHLGHLRNNFLGYSVSEILKANGYDVVKTQIINDRGIHICKSMLAWQKYGEGSTPQSTGLKGDKFVGQYYVKFDQVLKVQTAEKLKEWEASNFSHLSAKDLQQVKEWYEALSSASENAEHGIRDKLTQLAKNYTEIMIEAQEMLQKWENKDPKVYELWETMNGWVYSGFDTTYANMGVDFDKLYYESSTYITGKTLVEKGLQSGIFFSKEDGSVWINLTDEGLDEKLVLRGDGTAVYMTQDMGTASLRYSDYPNLSGITYTVGNEQDYHFKVLFLILEKLGYNWAKNCQHLSYGMVDLPSGKMKSREGTVVDADDLMSEIVEKAKAGAQERGHIEGLSEAEKEQLYRMVGMGGLKYYLLKVDPKKRMLFDPAESVDLNGNTGPFIQYTHARIASVLKAGGERNTVSDKVDLHDSERELIKTILEFPMVIKEAGQELSPALIANYSYNLVKQYNSFYQSVSILKEDDKAKVNLRLQISSVVGEIINKSMRLLGIEVPNQM